MVMALRKKLVMNLEVRVLMDIAFSRHNRASSLWGEEDQTSSTVKIYIKTISLGIVYSAIHITVIRESVGTVYPNRYCATLALGLKREGLFCCATLLLNVFCPSQKNQARFCCCSLSLTSANKYSS